MNTPEIFALRLRQAREMYQMSMESLIERLKAQGLTLTKQAISKYENAENLPSSTTLVAISSAFGLPIDHFFREQMFTLSAPDFRKVKSRLSVSEEKRVVSTATSYFERYVELERLLGEAPQYEAPFKRLVKTGEEAEAASRHLRKIWKLDIHPIASLFELLEDKDIKICMVKADSAFDGFRAYADDQLVICVNKCMKPKLESGKTVPDKARIRFNLAHELAHDILEFPEDMPTKEREKLCHRFAGALLMPSDPLMEALGGSKRSSITLFELKALKEEYGISIKALGMRLYQCGLITQQTHRSFSIYYNQQKFGRAKNEPGSFNGREKPTRFKILIGRALAQERISVSKAAELLGVDITAVRENYQVLS